MSSSSETIYSDSDVEEGEAQACDGNEVKEEKKELREYICDEKFGVYIKNAHFLENNNCVKVLFFGMDITMVRFKLERWMGEDGRRRIANVIVELDSKSDQEKAISLLDGKGFDNSKFHLKCTEIAKKNFRILDNMEKRRRVHDSYRSDHDPIGDGCLASGYPEFPPGMQMGGSAGHNRSYPNSSRAGGGRFREYDYPPEEDHVYQPPHGLPPPPRRRLSPNPFRRFHPY